MMPSWAVADSSCHWSMSSVLSTYRRTPSSLTVVNLYRPAAKDSLLVRRTEKLSAGTDGSGEPWFQTKLTVGSLRVSTGVPDSSRLAKYWPTNGADAAYVAV